MLSSCYFMSMEIKYTKVFFTIYHWKVWILVVAMLHTVQCVDTEGCSLYKWLVWHRINILASWTRGFHELSKSLQINWDELINNNAVLYCKSYSHILKHRAFILTWYPNFCTFKIFSCKNNSKGIHFCPFDQL